MNTTPIEHNMEFMVFDKNIPTYAEAMDEKEATGCIVNFEYVKESHYLEDALNGKYPILQRTAIRSINNEPIYNHMIVKDDWENYYVVDMFDYYKMYFLNRLTIEIVGNRFQSPKLLELCK